MDNIVTSTKQKMQKVVEILQQDFATVRSGKANPSMVENIMIEAYEGTHMRVMELATVSAQDAYTLIVNPYDKTVMSKIQKGIEDAELGISPAAAGEVIRIVLPPLTEERRKDFVKLINQKAEHGKVMIRQNRHEAMEDIKKHEDSSAEDEVTRLEKEVQKLTDEFIAKIDSMRSEKEKELMTI
ncbi:MAG TPA: ribosome recycling factor [Candidatus Levybacteria bacterium]|nr:ribosome recycling factor [Candidatus Levybacteria bacterium]